MSDDPVLAQLTEVIPARELVTDPDILAGYAHDEARFCEHGAARALVRARSVQSVVDTLKVASRSGTPVVTRGAGTGLAGGANALEGCIQLSLERMDQILEIDPDAHLARVQAGVLNGELDRAVAEHGLMYAPDPASRDISTIGGNVATNAGAPFTMDGYPASWVSVLEKVEALDVKTIVPGHGPLGDKGMATTEREFLASLTGETRKRLDSGMSVEKAIADITVPGFESWSEGEVFETSVERLYLELRGQI